MARSIVHWRNRLPQEFNNEIDGLFNTFFGQTEGDNRTHMPHANFAETDAGYEISVDLPGMNPDDVQIELTDGNLVITGERKQESAEEGKTWHHVERRWGTFQRKLALPKAVDQEKIEATFKNGVLTVDLPKKAEVQPKRIQVKAAE